MKSVWGICREAVWKAARLGCPWKRNFSGAEDVAAELGVAPLVCPQSERDGGEFIHLGDRQAVLGEIDGLDVPPASFAGFYADMLELRSHVDTQSLIAALLARRARDSEIIPLRRAKRADERPLGAVSFGPQNTRQGLRPTEGTDGPPDVGGRNSGAVGKVLYARP